MKRLRNKSGANRLGFAMLMKFFEVEARFPETDREVPAAAVGYVAQQVKAPADQWAAYDWQGDRIKRHRKEIRTGGHGGGPGAAGRVADDRAVRGGTVA